MSGRKPKPTALKLITGNPGKRALPKFEPKPQPGAEMPDWLSDEAKAQWALVAQQLEASGILTQIDGPALGLYCEAFARWRHANDQVVKFGSVVKAPSGFPVQSPFLAIANRAWDQMMKALVEFGMTPSSRSRVTANGPQEEERASTGLASFRR